MYSLKATGTKDILSPFLLPSATALHFAKPLTMLLTLLHLPGCVQPSAQWEAHPLGCYRITNTKSENSIKSILITVV